MKKQLFTPFLGHLLRSLWAVALVAAVALLLLLIGRKTLGEGVIASVFLVCIVGITLRWGGLPGSCAALASAMLFDFFFIPPFFTFVVGGLEGWLMLGIFLGVSVVVVNRIQLNLVRLHDSIFLSELSAALSVTRSSDAVARIAAKHVRQLSQVALARVVFTAEGPFPEIIAAEPNIDPDGAQPDQILPIENDRGLVGEIQLWRNSLWPDETDRTAILRAFAFQTGRVLGRTRQTEWESKSKAVLSSAKRKR
jgi:K+-sensing histidine kinase KdpD